MNKRLVAAVAVLTTAFATLAATASAAPQPVTMTILESKTDGGAASGTFAGIGSVFGSGVSGGTSTGSFSPDPALCFAAAPPPPPPAGPPCISSVAHDPKSFVFSASISVSTSEGTFSIVVEGSFAFVGFVDPIVTLESSGDWQVSGGTGAYARLQGEGTFTEVFLVDVNTGNETGTDTFTGQLQTT